MSNVLNIDTLLPLIEIYIIQFTHINTELMHSFMSFLKTPNTSTATPTTTATQLEQLGILMALGIVAIQSMRLLFSLTILYTVLYAYRKTIRLINY